MIRIISYKTPEYSNKGIQFVTANISKLSNLPSNSWERITHDSKILYCEGFSVSASLSNISAETSLDLKLRDENTTEEIEKKADDFVKEQSAPESQQEIKKVSQQPLSFVKKTIEPCILNKSEAPALRGIRLGMTREQVSKVLKYPIGRGSEVTTTGWYEELDPVTKKKVRQSGEVEFGVLLSTLTIDQEQLRANPELKGVEAFGGWFFNNRIYRLNLTYDKKLYNFESLDGFVSNLAVLLKIPKQMWKVEDNSEHRDATAECQGFRVDAHIENPFPELQRADDNIEIMITDEIITSELGGKASMALTKLAEEARLKKSKEAKMKESEKIFKP